MNKTGIFIIVLTISLTVSAQKEAGPGLSLGFGYYETITLGFSYYLNPENKIGISAGSSFMINNEMYYCIIIEDNLAILRSKMDSKSNYKWYLTGKILYWDMEDDYYRWNVLSISPAVTRVFKLNDRLNFTADLGPVFTIVLESYRKTYEGLGWPYHVMPNMRLLLNFSF